MMNRARLSLAFLAGFILGAMANPLIVSALSAMRYMLSLRFGPQVP